MNDNKISKFLIVGFSGAGKTHYLEQRRKEGKRGADLDELIITGNYSSTRQMILEIGLEEFRKLEFMTFKDWFLGAGEGEYLSLGGGAVHEKSINWLKARNDWQAIYLDKSFDECMKGMKKRGSSYLLELDPKKVHELYVQRLNFYKKLIV